MGWVVMARGPKPKAPQLRILNGNASKRPISEARVVASIPKAPKVLTAEAKREWKRITKELGDLNKLTELSLSDLTGYCVWWGRLLKAEAKLKREGEVLKGRNGGPYQNPWLAVAKRASEQVARFATRLGLERLNAAADATDEFEDFLNNDEAAAS